MAALADASFEDVERLRATLSVTRWGSVEAAAKSFVGAFFDGFTDIALVRIFTVVPAGAVPARERAFAVRAAAGHLGFSDSTPVLTLLGTRGRDVAWNDRRVSNGHLCIPLLDRSFVDGAPMLAKLLADLDVDLSAFDDGRPIATRRLLGGKNGMFYVPDASTALDAQGRHIIADQSFVRRHSIRTVFGMGGAYLDGTLVTSIVFCTSAPSRLVVDRFPSLIVSFKIATAELVANQRLFEERSGQ
jgi:hypothetical protein